MQGDFSRLTFNPRKHYRSVHMQQGRVQLDADWNEQIDILNHYFETQLRDLLGASGAMVATAGFQIEAIERTPQLSTISPETEEQIAHQEQNKPLRDLLIKRGNYYVDGLLCENEQDVLFSTQPYYPGAQIPATPTEWSIVYLDVWQRHITAFEDASLREIALGGPDTTTRTQMIWQVKGLPVVHRHSYELFGGGRNATSEEVVKLPEWRELIHRQIRKPELAARHIPNSSTLDNQLYRVEIHHINNNKATFKWSRENGSIVFGVEKILSYEKNEDGFAQSVVTLSNSGQDMTQLRKGDWVEFVYNDVTSHGYTLPLYQVIEVSEATQRHITLTGRYAQVLEKLTQTNAGSLLVRRWDQAQATTAALEAGTYSVVENTWIDLERGIQVKFSPGDTYNIGDYWLIPSRALFNDIEWPAGANGPLALPPHGVEHHFCPLALIHLDRHQGPVTKDLRRLFAPLPTLTERITDLQRPEVITTEIIEQRATVARNVLSEECSSQSDLVPGDLVSLLPGTNLEVTKASRENAKLIFGVVSGIAEVAGQKRFRVTTYGRARCKIAGPVEAGDLLTVAEENGYAMRTGPVHEFLQAGSLVGKALEAYTPKTSDSASNAIIADMIDVLVSLQ
jgi:hypothetical protein